MRLKSIVILLFTASNLLAQNTFNPVNGFDFDFDQSIPVFENGNELPLAWAGGINYGALANLDLDLDGHLDMVVYDKSGNRVLPFLATLDNNQNKYTYAPQYTKFLPSIENWVISVDYNCDGKLDLFVGSGQFMKVYTNNSNTELSFTKAHTSNYLQTQLYLGPNALQSLRTDIPAVIDLDDDGAVDILTVSGGGVIVYKNKNACGLDFEIVGECWGKFLENGIVNDVFLDSCDYSPTGKRESTNKTMHAGGALLALDLNNDGLKDLLMSDVSFSSTVALFNGGTKDSAVMTSKITNYPSTKPIDVYLYPALYYADATGDGVKDLLVTPNETGINQLGGGGLSGSENVNNVQLYKNTGTNTNPTFSFVQDNFLQEHMIDMGEGAVPRFVDLNGDSLQDLILANDGEFTSPGNYSTYLRYYQNTGTKDSAVFTLVDGDFAQMSSYNIGRSLVPTFGDLDGDQDFDMIIGGADGKLHYFVNVGTAVNPNYNLQTAGLAGIDIGSNAAPFLIDLNGDGTLDMLVGTQDGAIFYYTNSSTTTPTFSLVSSKLGGIRTVPTFGGSGHSIPYAFRDSSGTINLMVGSSLDGIWQYDSLGTQVLNTSSTNYAFGNDSVISTNYLETPFGIKKRTGRNQFIFSAQELKNAGVGFGYIDAIQLFAHVDASFFPPFLMQKGFTISMKNSSRTDLSTGFETGMTIINNARRIPIDNGWNRIKLDEPFLYDGSSSLVVEICFSSNNPQSFDLMVDMTDVGYPAHAYGDAMKNGYNSSGLIDGCDMPYEATITKRPNIKFEVTPAFDNTNRILNTGYFLAPAFADINNDGFIDVVIGNNAGGVQFFKGKKYTQAPLSLPETASAKQLFSVYPNPSNGLFYVKLQNNSIAKLNVYGLNGQLLHKQDIRQAQQEINLNKLPQGIYLFVLQAGNDVQTIKVVKQGY